MTMDRGTELALIDELLTLKASKTAFLDDAISTNPIDHYLSEERFQLEQTKLFRRLPNAAAHASELPEPGSFVRRTVGGSPVLVTRDKTGAVNAFLNVCRHRGTRLVDEEHGCKHRFTCPYHAWTYASTGELIAAPHFKEGFPDIDMADLGLVSLNCQERYGFVWVWSSADDEIDLSAYFEALDHDLASLNIAEHAIAAESSETRAANWKILVEGGIEAYHFRIAHRSTIGPHFEDNLSSYRSFGPHMRAVLPRTSMKTLTEQARDSWRLRDHANVLYTLFPSSQLLVMQDHVVWIRSEPLSAGETALRLVTLAPSAGWDAEGKDAAHWKRNHQITSATLDEDFEIGASIQASIAAGANTEMIFGRFEGALGQFNRTIAVFLEDDSAE
jgi:phenylpropionate dioxygenase-like ring-hydroxylating dioxygenase large terminal subunit